MVVAPPDEDARATCRMGIALLVAGSFDGRAPFPEIRLDINVVDHG
jgi:hypothetical protein